MSETKIRMDAYYYGFTPTGVEAIDKILSAVACAGKAYHHTEDWNDKAEWRGHRGNTPAEWIQNAAIDAAATPIDDRAQWAIDNIYTVARRETARQVADERADKMWRHVIRLCESVGARERSVGVLRKDVAESGPKLSVETGEDISESTREAVE